MVISYLYVQTVIRQCFCFPNSQWGVTAHDSMTATHTESVKPSTSRSEGGKDPNVPGTSISLVAHTYSFTCWHPPRHQTPHSPSYSPSGSRSLHCCVEGSKPQSRSHTSDSSVSTLSNSSSTESESDSEHLGVTPTVRSDTAPVHQTSSS